MRRESCAACGGELRDFLDLGSSPPADRFAATPDEEEAWYPLQAAVCTHCWLAQLREVVPDGELYGDDYGFRTGSSPAAVTYFGGLAHELTALYPDRAAQLTVEIGCNDGTLLDEMRKAAVMPVRALGVDPSGAVAEAVIGRKTPAYREPFTAKLAGEIREEYGPAGLVLAFNVVAHVADPRDFLAGVAALLGVHGVAVIEFQDCEKLIAGCQFDHVYHEHRFFFTLRSFARIARYAGLAVTDWERTPAQGGSLRVTLARQCGELPAANMWLERWEPYASMQDRALYAKMRLLELLGAEREQGRVVAGWGASAKSATLLNWCGISPREVPWIEDLTPGKVGRYAPGSRIPVRAPGLRPDTYLVTSWNYAGSMVRDGAGFLGLGGRLIIPGPVPVLLLRPRISAGAVRGRDRVVAVPGVDA
jgi:methylation protein EvaC